MGDRYSAFTAAEGTTLSSDLGFLANTVVVDNLTASWLFMPNVGRFVPPFTYGATFPLGAGVQVAQALWRTPPGVTAPTAGTGQAQLTFTSAALPPSNGVPVIIPSQQVPLPVSAVVSLSNPGGSGSAATVGQTTINLGTTQASKVVVQYAVPAGANSLIIVGNATGAQTSEFNFSITVRGTTTNTFYTAGSSGAANTGSQGPPPLAVVIASAADTTIEVTYTGNASGVVATFEVCAVFGTQAIAVQNTPATILTVQGGQAGGGSNTPGDVLSTGGFGGTSGFKQTNNGAVIFTNTPDSTHFVHLMSITVQFGGAPSGAPSLTVVGSLQGTIWQVNTNSQTPLHFPFMDGGIRGLIGETITVTLGASGVAGVFGLMSIVVDTRTF